EEIGVGFNAVDEKDVVGGEGSDAAVNRRAGRGGADLANFHGGADGNSHGFFTDAVGGEKFGLAFGRGAAVTAHRRKDKRFRADGTEQIKSGADDLGKVGDAATADADGDDGVGFYLQADDGELVGKNF